MANQTPTQPAMSGADGFNVLLDQVYAPTFFHKLATDFKVTPQSEEQAHALLRMAGQLRNLSDAARLDKQASARDPILAAEQALLAITQAQPDQTATVTKIAAELGKKPQLRAAVLAYQTAIAEQCQQAAQAN